MSANARPVAWRARRSRRAVAGGAGGGSVLMTGGAARSTVLSQVRNAGVVPATYGVPSAYASSAYTAFPTVGIQARLAAACARWLRMLRASSHWAHDWMPM